MKTYSQSLVVVLLLLVEYENKEYHDVFPGKVYNIDVWTTAVDDDGYPEDICISFYLELIPYEEAFPKD